LAFTLSSGRGNANSLAAHSKVRRHGWSAESTSPIRWVACTVIRRTIGASEIIRFPAEWKVRATVALYRSAGRIIASNLTPDKETGAGNWSDDAMARAIREGIGYDDRTLFPIMPYVHYRTMPD